MAELFDFVGEAEGLTASLGAVWASPDAVVALDEWAAHLARFHPRVLAVTRAADMLFALISTDLLERLLQERRWSQRRLARQLALLLRSTFLAPDDRSMGASPGRDRYPYPALRGPRDPRARTRSRAARRRPPRR